VPFTRSHDDIEKAMAGVKMGYSGTRLYDAMARGVSLLSERPANRRRVLLVLAEAADTGSEANLGEIIRDAQLNNITIYSVGLSTAAANLRKKPEQRGPAPIGPEGTFPVPGRNGSPQTPTSEQQERSRHADLIPLIIMIVKTAAHTVKDNSLEVATAATGGMHVATFKDESIEHALDEIGGELHAQYTLTYRPTGTDPYGFHEIKVQVAQRGMKARTRPGYYLGEKN
jgi:VWFA-related protein